jgi:Fe-S-cluster-containing dehydrogenase component
MSKNIILVDLDRCTGCHTCEIACKTENEGKQYVDVAQWGPEILGGEMRTFYIPLMSGPSDDCRERLASGLDTPCMSVCPTEALRVTGIPTENNSEEEVVLYKSGG